LEALLVSLDTSRIKLNTPIEMRSVAIIELSTHQHMTPLWEQCWESSED